MRPDTFRRASLSVLAGLGLLAAAIALPLSGAADDASTTNRGPLGASGFAAIVEAAAARSGAPPPRVFQGTLADLPAPAPRASLLILAPASPFTTAEGRAVARFLDAGGRVFVADDVGVANTLLERLGTATRVSGVELIDLAYSRQPHFPLLYSIRPHPMTEGVDALLANVPTSVRPDANATVVVASSGSSWLDADADALPGPGDQRGPHAVLSDEPIGRGDVIVLSDPSILSNAMLGAADNHAFAENVARSLTAGASQLYIDESHRPHRPFALLAGALPTADDAARGIALAVLLGVPATVAAAAWAGHRIARARDRRRADPAADAVETVLKRNPQWSERDVRRSASGLEAGRRHDGH